MFQISSSGRMPFFSTIEITLDLGYIRDAKKAFNGKEKDVHSPPALPAPCTTLPSASVWESPAAGRRQRAPLSFTPVPTHLLQILLPKSFLTAPGPGHGIHCSTPGLKKPMTEWQKGHMSICLISLAQTEVLF